MTVKETGKLAIELTEIASKEDLTFDQYYELMEKVFNEPKPNVNDLENKDGE